MNLLLPLLFAWPLMAIVMLVVWLWQRRSGNAGIVDVAWTFGVGSLAVAFVALGEGLPTRRLLVAVLAGLWSLRLGSYLIVRVHSHAEDGRYQRLKAEWGENAQRRLFWFFQSQAVAAVLFAAPMLITAQATAPLGWADLVGIAIWCIALVGEWLADRQLARFRAHQNNRGRVCNEGLWRYSRHPNYFFEWLHWWCYVPLAAAAPWGWLTILAPLAMLYLFLYVTGIPPAEAQALESRGEVYREYQRTTSAFWPWLPTRS